MAGLTHLLAWLLLALTFTGTYRLSDAVTRGNSRIYPLLLATTMTLTFAVVLDVVLLIVGLSVLCLPVLYVFRSTEIGSRVVESVRRQLEPIDERVATRYDEIAGEESDLTVDLDRAPDNDP